MNGKHKLTLNTDHWFISSLRRHRHILAALITMVSALYGYLWLINPQVNPRPKKKVVVHGVFPFDRGWDLRIQQSFRSQNPTCRQTARIFLFIPQAEVGRDRMLPPVAVKRLEGSMYEVEYFEDYFLPGICDWTANFTFYRIFENSNYLQGGAMLGFPDRFNKIDYDCGNMRRPKTGELALTCYEGNNHSFSSDRRDGGEVNFFWKEIEK